MEAPREWGYRVKEREIIIQALMLLEQALEQWEHRQASRESDLKKPRLERPNKESQVASMGQPRRILESV